MKKIVTLIAAVCCFNTNAQIITTVAGTGSAAFSGDNGQATAAAINQPYRVCFDAAGNFYIADESNNRIRKVNTAGVITTFAGNGVQGFSGDGGQATAAGLYSPLGMIFDGAGNMFITDEDNFRIRKVNTLGVITTVAGSTPGFAGDGGQATAAQLLRPNESIVDAAGNIYILDSQNSRVRKVNTSGIINTIAGSGTSGTYAGDNGPATAAEMNNPSGLAADPNGNIYVADTYNNRIRMISTMGIITTFAGTGTAGFTGDGGQATAAEINYPRGVAFAGGNLFIVDEGNNRIRMVNTAGVISTIVGNGTAGSTGDGGAATAAELHSPGGVAFDANGNMFIADWANNRIRKVTNVLQMGIQQLTGSKDLVNVYPNPAKDNFTIETSNTSKQTLQIVDITGKMVVNKSIEGKITIDATNLSEGVYNINIIGVGNNSIVNKKLVIVK